MSVILVAEQDAGYAERIAETLRASGWPSQVVVSHDEAMQAAAAARPRLLLASATLGNANALLSTFSRSRGGPGSIVLVPDAVASQVSAADYHADELLAKPFSETELCRLVDQALALGQASEADSIPKPSRQLTSEDIFGDLLAEVEEEARQASQSAIPPAPSTPGPGAAPTPPAAPPGATPPRPQVAATPPPTPAAPPRKERSARSRQDDIDRKLEETLSGVMPDRLRRSAAPEKPKPPARPRTDLPSDDEIDDLLDRTLSSLELPTRSRKSSKPAATKTAAASPPASPTASPSPAAAPPPTSAPPTSETFSPAPGPSSDPPVLGGPSGTSSQPGLDPGALGSTANPFETAPPPPASPGSPPPASTELADLPPADLGGGSASPPGPSSNSDSGAASPGAMADSATAIPSLEPPALEPIAGSATSSHGAPSEPPSFESPSFEPISQAPAPEEAAFSFEPSSAPDALPDINFGFELETEGEAPAAELSPGTEDAERSAEGPTGTWPGLDSAADLFPSSFADDPAPTSSFGAMESTPEPSGSTPPSGAVATAEPTEPRTFEDSFAAVFEAPSPEGFPSSFGSTPPAFGDPDPSPPNESMPSAVATDPPLENAFDLGSVPEPAAAPSFEAESFEADKSDSFVPASFGSTPSLDDGGSQAFAPPAEASPSPIDDGSAVFAPTDEGALPPPNSFADAWGSTPAPAPTPSTGSGVESPASDNRSFLDGEAFAPPPEGDEGPEAALRGVLELRGDDDLATRRLETVDVEPEDGQRFGDYALLERVAVGGMAEVWRARRRGVEGFQKIVAIKRILSHLTDTSDFIDMFIDEAKLAAQLSHANIIQIYDLGKADGDFFIAMEYVEGKDLRTLFKTAAELGRPMPLGLGLLVVAAVARALDYAHRKKDFDDRALGLVHRDVSPQNVLISYEGEIKLCDFGIVKAVAKASTTQMGALKGKLQYMSPEQAWGKPVDARSDIFSLGSVLFEVVTGEKLFTGDSEITVLDAVRECRVRSPRELVPDVSEAVERIVFKALTKSPEQRYQTAGEMEKDLQVVIRELQPAPTPGDLANYLKSLYHPDDQFHSYSPRDGEAAVSVSKPAGAEPAPAKAPAETKKSSGKGLWIIALVGVVLFLVLAAVAAWFFLGGGDSAEAPATPPPAVTAPAPAAEGETTQDGTEDAAADGAEEATDVEGAPAEDSATTSETPDEGASAQADPETAPEDSATTGSETAEDSSTAEGGIDLEALVEQGLAAREEQLQEQLRSEYEDQRRELERAIREVEAAGQSEETEDPPPDDPDSDSGSDTFR